MFRRFIQRHKKGIKNALRLIFLCVFTLGLVWVGSWQLDMISSLAVDQYYPPDAKWWFPFFGSWYDVGWSIRDAYVRMFIFIWVGLLSFGIGMFLTGYYWEE